MSVKNIEDIYRLSPMQQGMLFHSILSPESGMYFEQSTYKLRGNLDVEAFKNAWQTALNRHTSLRTAFMWEDIDEPLQIVYQKLDLPFSFIDWSKDSPTTLNQSLEEYLRNDREKGFKLDNAPLMRLALIKIDIIEYFFVWSHHHLLLDGWSQPIIIQDVFRSYETTLNGLITQFESVRPYRDYIAWLQRQDNAEARAYWQGVLRGFSAPTKLPEEYLLDKTNENQTPEIISDKGDYAIHAFILSQDLSDALNILVRQSKLTLNTLIQGAWAILLSRYSGERDVLFGATVSGRPADLPGAESIVGLFINTLPIHVQVDPDSQVETWLHDLQSQQAISRQYEYTPLYDIQSWSEVPKDVPLFESLLVFENYPIDDAGSDRKTALNIEKRQVFTRTNYPLTIAFSPGKRIGIEIAYECDRFTHSGIRRLQTQLETVLEKLSRFIDVKIKDLPTLSDTEFKKIVIEWNNTTADIYDENLISKIFEGQTEKSPQNIVVQSGDVQLSYGQLNQRINQLTHYISKLGVGPGVIVGISIERSIDMIVAIMAVLKSGAAYLPIDPSYPSDRVAYLVKDSNVELLITQEKYAGNFPLNKNQMVYIDTQWENISLESEDNPEISIDPNNIAYVIYTSGSTGKPKGVMISHRSLVNNAVSMKEYTGLTDADRSLQFISLSFDASVDEIFPTLISGACLVIPPVDEELLGVELFKYCQKHAISVISLPVPIWQHSLDEMRFEDFPMPESLRSILLGGESIAMDKLLFWSEKAEQRIDVPPMSLLYAYGPTETTSTTTLYKTNCTVDSLVNIHQLPIGKPIANKQVYILDEFMQPVPIGALGELYIGGIGVARGYLTRPELTADVFVADSYSQKPGERLYRTGDLARFLPSGDIEFMGRIDDQVKLRGFRVELGEVESIIREFDQVRDAIVRIHVATPEDKRLVAYITIDKFDVPSQEEFNLTKLQDYVKSRLPHYMVPAVYMILDELPKTPSGKVDRKALPAPGGERPALEEVYLSPRNAIEEIIVGIWSDILGVDRVGVHDNFFDLGGHSLKATQLLSRLRQTFEVDLGMRSIFETPTVASIADEISTALEEKSDTDAAPQIVPIPRDEITGIPIDSPPLSFSQQRLWFLDQLDPGNLAWNIPLFVRITGHLDLLALERSLIDIVNRHESLRTTFDSLNGRPIQVIHSDTTVKLKIIDVSDILLELDNQKEIDQEIEKICRFEVQQTFDLQIGPLINLALLRLSDNEHILILTIHHIIADGWSLSILVNEITQLYQTYTAIFSLSDTFEEKALDLRDIDAHPQLILPELAIQYADYSVWQRNWLQGKVLKNQLDYWKEQLAGVPPILDLPTDHPRPALKTANGSSENFLYPKEFAEKIISLSQQTGVTPYMFLLAAYQVLLYRYSNQDDVCVGTAVANRTQPEIEGLIGFFVNTLVMRSDLSGNPSFRELLIRVRETALGAYAHQDLPFETLVEELQPKRNLSYTPLFQVGFDYQDSPVESLHLPGLTLQSVQLDSGTTPYDLLLSITHTRSEENTEHYLSGSLEYNTDLYEASTIQKMLSHYQKLLEEISSDLDQNIDSLQILTDDELQEILIDWNSTQIEFPYRACIHQRFESRVLEKPHETALVYESQSISYAELNRKANQLAHYIRKLGVKQEVIVGISTDRSPDMIVAILGVLKAGGAYLPLDPTYPVDRLGFMVNDSQISILISQSQLVERLPDVKTKILLDYDWDKIQNESDENPSLITTPDNLAYVIYTSGSTGRPKGSLLQHRGLCNLAEAQRIAFDIDNSKRVLQFSPFSFDASVWETFMALANGASLCLAHQETLSSGLELIRLLKEKEVTTVTLPPSLLSILPEDQISITNLPMLNTVIAAGEACTEEIVKRWARGRKFFNAYGPTETTVCASMKLCDENDSGDPPIGRPVANTKLYILDQNFQPVPVGVPGELMVGGVSLARGYFDRPEMTAGKFIPNPFMNYVTGSRLEEKIPPRLYRTGDLVRYRVDGDIEFLGRIDFQVKVRGFRIELGEIESALRSFVGPNHSSFRDAVTIVREDTPGDKRLVAYLVLDDSADEELLPPSSNELKQFLRELLPEYMIPSAFVFLESFPISPAGKVDRIALANLPAPEIERQELTSEFIAPRNPMEEKLVDICINLLGIEQTGEQSPIGVYDNFFELGGHSLLATQFISRIREEFSVELPLRTLFEHPTVAELVLELEILMQQGEHTQQPVIKRVSREARSVKRSSLQGDNSEN